VIKDLATLRFVDNAENVVFLGPPGVGKTHLAIGLGVAAIRGSGPVHQCLGPDRAAEGCPPYRATGQVPEETDPVNGGVKVYT